jgi:hypothetical protein
MNKGLLKRFLQYVFGILVVPHHAPCHVKDPACGLLAKALERGRISTLCSGQKLVFLSRKRAPSDRLTRSSPVVILQTLRGHVAAPFRQSQLVIPSSWLSDAPPRRRIDSWRG